MAKKILTQDTTNYNNVQGLADLVEDQSTIIKQTFDKAGNDQKTFMNSTHITELQDSTEGTSGSYGVGHGSPLISADNVGDALEENAQAIIDVTLGEIPNDSLTNAKLATDIKVGSLFTLNTNDKDSVTDAMNEIALSTKVYDAVTTVSEISITTDATFPYADGKFINFKADANITAPATIQIDGGAVLTAKDVEGNNIDITQNTIYLCQFVDDATDFFELAPRGGESNSIGFYGKVVNLIPSNGWTAETNMDVLPDADTPAWTLTQTGGTSSVSSGELTINTNSSQQRYYTRDTIVDNTKITVFELKLKTGIAAAQNFARVEIDDGTQRSIALITGTLFRLNNGAADSEDFSYTMTDYHILKLVKYDTSKIEYYIDDQLVKTSTVFLAGVSNRLMFGCVAVAEQGSSIWDYARYNIDSTITIEQVNLLSNGSQTITVEVGQYVSSSENAFIDDGGVGQEIPSISSATSESQLQATVEGTLKSSTTISTPSQIAGQVSNNAPGWTTL